MFGVAAYEQANYGGERGCLEYLQASDDSLQINQCWLMNYSNQLTVLEAIRCLNEF